MEILSLKIFDKISNKIYLKSQIFYYAFFPISLDWESARKEQLSGIASAVQPSDPGSFPGIGEVRISQSREIEKKIA